jgi:predicted MPP superfamily phosphohydrolase
VWAIRGNHDFWEAADEVRDALACAGIGLLANRRTEIRRDDAVFDLVGIESPWTPSCEAWQDLINPSSPQRLTIVLTHTPDNAPVVARRGATLMLAGHTHGGQIRFPLIGSLIVPSRYGKRYDEGWFAVGPLALYVNRGIGSFSPDMRLACRPEIARLILRAEVANGSAGQSSR